MKNKLLQLAGGVYLAQNQTQGINSGLFQQIGGLFGGQSGSPVKSQTLGEIIFLVVQIFLIVAGSIAVLFIIYGGFKYVLSRGEPSATESAKHTISSAIIGLIVIILSFAIVRIISEVLFKGTGGLGL